MSHTVVRLTNARITSEMEAENLCTKLEKELNNRGYKTHDVTIGDNTNASGEILLRAVIDFVYSSEADSWATFLNKFVKDNLAADGEEGIKSATVDEHDCMHMQGMSGSCEPVQWKHGA